MPEKNAEASTGFKHMTSMIPVPVLNCEALFGVLVIRSVRKCEYRSEKDLQSCQVT